MKARSILILLLIISLLEILGECIFIQKDIPYLVYIFKPLLMPTLIFWYVKQSKKPLNILIFALVFSFFGDVFLMFLALNENFFLLGLASFLITHVLYTYIFLKYVDKTKRSILRKRPHLLLPFVLYGLSLVLYLYREANANFLVMQVPVIVYASVIMCMVFAALARFEKVNQKSFSWIMVGALLFMFSDTFIALNNFSSFFEHSKCLAKILIMSLYVLGQFAIVKGILFHFRK